MLDNERVKAYLKSISPAKELSEMRTIREASQYMAHRRRLYRDQMIEAQNKYIVMPNRDNLKALLEYTVAFTAYGATGAFGRQLKGRVFPDDPASVPVKGVVDEDNDSKDAGSGREDGRRRDLLLRGDSRG